MGPAKREDWHREEAEEFYRQLKVWGLKVRVGMEASGHGRWFERLLTELQFELWIGDAAAAQKSNARSVGYGRNCDLLKSFEKRREIRKTSKCDGQRPCRGHGKILKVNYFSSNDNFFTYD